MALAKRMMANEPVTNEEWRAWGEVDPMFGGASWAGRRQGRGNAWTEGEFYALGESDWNDFLSLWQRVHPVRTGAVMEIGAGAGRMSSALARTFDTVYALDVSPGMLAFARRNVDASNINWMLVDGIQAPLEDASVDAVSLVMSCSTCPTKPWFGLISGSVFACSGPAAAFSPT